MSKFLDTWSPLVAFLFLAIVGGYAIQQSAERDANLLREGLLQSCERANARDEASNKRADIMSAVLTAAAESREREASIAQTAEERRVNLQVAAKYRELADAVPKVKSVDCEAVVPRP